MYKVKIKNYGDTVYLRSFEQLSKGVSTWLKTIISRQRELSNIYHINYVRETKGII